MKRVLIVAVLAACAQQAPVATPSASSNAPTLQEKVLTGRHLVIVHVCGDCHGGFANPAAPGWLAGVMSPQQEFQIGWLRVCSTSRFR